MDIDTFMQQDASWRSPKRLGEALEVGPSLKRKSRFAAESSQQQEQQDNYREASMVQSAFQDQPSTPPSSPFLYSLVSSYPGRLSEIRELLLELRGVGAFLANPGSFYGPGAMGGALGVAPSQLATLEASAGLSKLLTKLEALQGPYNALFLTGLRELLAMLVAHRDGALLVLRGPFKERLDQLLRRCMAVALNPRNSTCQPAGQPFTLSPGAPGFSLHRDFFPGHYSPRASGEGPDIPPSLGGAHPSRPYIPVVAAAAAHLPGVPPAPSPASSLPCVNLGEMLSLWNRVEDMLTE